DGETGLLFPCGDYEALAANVITLLEDQSLAAGLISRARAACRQYTWTATRGSWLKIYADMLEDDR
ncbi:MAG TPA: glycosyltransferase family 1 protein, partial [Blastocatellia bacterium]|nr:glycosyltransferase family 1 protein [Blastocatellia bacterium]